jgi:hypothetical protein
VFILDQTHARPEDRVSPYELASFPQQIEIVDEEDGVIIITSVFPIS